MAAEKTELYRVADYIADAIAAMGVKEVFLLPGGGSMYLNDAVGKHPKINVVACLHEQAAAISAEAYGRIHLSGIGVVMVTTGPGATNALTAVAGAWIESVPMMVISGQVKRADMLHGAPLRQRGPQEVDIISMIKGITKYAKTIEKVEDIRQEFEKAFYLAREGRGGPVWLDIPLDIQARPVDSSSLFGYVVPAAADKFSNYECNIEESVSVMIELLKQAERPLILAGHGVRLSGGEKLFRAIVERMDVPVVTTWNALDLLPYDYPLYVGRPGVVALRAPNFAVQNCDLLISIGSRLDNIITAYNPSGFARGAKKVIVDVDRHEIEKLDMNIALSIVGNAKTFLEAWLGTSPVVTPDWSDWKARCADWKQRYPVNNGEPFAASGPISHYQLMDSLSDAIPENTLVSTGSSGLAVEAFYTVFRNKPGQRVFLTSGLGAMGYGLAASIGSCFANECKPMVAVESDGSLQLNIQELATLRAFDLPICLIIMNNNGYASIRNTQRNYFKGRFVGTGPEAGLLLPDLEKVAATYDLPFLRITDAAELKSKLQQALSQPRPLLVDVRLTPDEALAPKVSALPQADGSMLSMPLEDMSPLLPLETLKAEMLVELLPQSLQARQGK